MGTSLRRTTLSVSLVVMLVTVIWPEAVTAGVNRWTTGGPEGGTIRSLAIDPANPSHVYAGTPAGVYRSFDDGESWQLASDGLSSPGEFLPNVPGLSFALTSPQTLYALTDRRVFTSTNQGTTWNATASFRTASDRVFTLAIDPVNPAIIYAGGNGGVHKSINGGASWTVPSADFSCLPVTKLVIDPSMPTVLYAGTCNGVFKTHDSGASWTSSNTGLFAQGILDLVIDPQTPSTLYAATTAGVFKTSDGASTWIHANSGLRGSNFAAPVLSLFIDPSVPSTLYAGSSGAGLFKTTNGAQRWLSINDGLPDSVHSGAVNGGRASTIYAGTQLGVFKSDNGGSRWRLLARGMTAAAADALVAEGTPSLLVNTSNGIFKSIDRGLSWRASGLGLPTGVNEFAADPSVAGTVYASAGNGVYKTVDGGNTWTRSSSGLTSGFVADALEVAPSDPSIVYASHAAFGHLFRSTNRGASWTFRSFRHARVLAVDPFDANVLYAASNGLSKSVNGGSTWIDLPALTHFVTALEVDPFVPSTIYAGTGGVGVGGVFKSVDAGVTWTNVSRGLPSSSDGSIRTLAIDPSDRAVIYVGTLGAGVFRSTNAGASWNAFNHGLTNGLIETVVIDSKTRSIHIATSAGVFDFEIGPVQRHRAVRH